MNKWADDLVRDKMHRRGLIRRFKASVRSLLAVVGWTAIVLAGFIAVMALRHEGTTRARLFDLALIFLGGAGVALSLYALIFLLPEFLEERGSRSRRQRSDESRSRSRPPARRMPASSNSSRDGMALVLVLVALALIAALVVQTQIAARALARHTEIRIGQSQLLNAASEAARAALQRLADDPDLLADSTNDAWAATEEVVQPDGIVTRTRVLDGNAAFDFNNLAAVDVPVRRTPEDILGDLHSLCGQFQVATYLASLRDWVDDDSDGLREKIAYAKEEPPYSPPNRFLFTWSELLQARGGTRDAFNRKERTSTLGSFDADLIDSVTVHPMARVRPVPININTASAETLQGVLGLGEDALVRTILTLRTIKPIRTFEDLRVVADPESLIHLRPYVAPNSSFFRVETQAVGGSGRLHLHALAHRDSAGRVQVLQWIF